MGRGRQRRVRCEISSLDVKGESRHESPVAGADAARGFRFFFAFFFAVPLIVARMERLEMNPRKQHPPRGGAATLPWGAETAHGRFVARRKRFFVDAVLDDGSTVVAHTANTGAMTGLLIPGAPVLFTRHDNKKRALPLELEAIHVGTSWVACNTIRANQTAAAVIRAGTIPELHAPGPGFVVNLLREVRCGDSRIDFCIEHQNTKTWVEVKSVTLRDGDVAAFPDVRSERALKHLGVLTSIAQQGAARAALLFIVQRTDTVACAAAWSVDPTYGEALRQAVRHGVMVAAVSVDISDEGIQLAQRLPVQLDPPAPGSCGPGVLSGNDIPVAAADVAK